MSSPLDRPDRKASGSPIWPSAANAIRPPRLGRWAIGAIFALLVVWFLSVMIVNPNLQWNVVAQYMFHPVVLRGLMMTLWLTLLSMIVGFCLGTILALCRLGPILPLQLFAGGFTWFFRSLPTLVLLIFLYNAAILVPEIAIRIPFGPVLWSQSTNAVMTPFVAAIIGLGFHKAAYMSEIIRAGLLSVDSGQRQAATALGMGNAKMLRRVVLPQAMRVIVPPTGSEIISTLKLTSLVSVISMSDLLYTIETIYSRTFQTIPLLMVACIWYLLLTSVLEFGQRYVERFFRRGYQTSGDEDRSPAKA